MHSKSNISITGFLVCLFLLGLFLAGCYGNPSRVVDNDFVGTWHIDTTRINISISVSPGSGADIAVFMPFVNENYQSFKNLLKEPESIVVTSTSAEDPSTGTYSLQFSTGYVFNGSYQLVRNILFLHFYDLQGERYTIPCQADGTTLQIVYSTPYMRALLKDYIAEYFPDEANYLFSVLSAVSPTIEGVSVYSTRIRGSVEQYDQP
ncbi:MAG: hypothetical protein GX281_03555 [Bacteroidales bacterium]|jgi:hypothetical protein|nr:hypothetical protein [Bacteroidales bacterium]NLK79781.1 hypothetical protein [Bacteroidales bacterium]HKM30745.1 hypothetical protein [Bacteroidales bacterium]HPX79349.1 hypothetical protein [Bacteroidales bacterium]HQB23019.1 hypothetical protein [Bacteroidales bacterium]